MILQKLLLPHNSIKTLYIRELDTLRREKPENTAEPVSITFPMTMKRGGVYSFGTYVNAFDIDRWTHFTPVRDITIRIRTTGDIQVQIYNSMGVYDETNDERHTGRFEVDADIFCEVNKDYREYIIELKDISYKGAVYPIIEAREAGTLLGGEYTTTTSVEVHDIKPVAVINYNKDAKSTRSTIEAVRNCAKQDMPIVVCDMTGELAEGTFEVIKQLSASDRRGDCANKAIDYIKTELEKDGNSYTHAIMIDNNIELAYEVLDRMLTFMSITDDFRDDLIIQGDVLRDGAVTEGEGYITEGINPKLSFANLDVSRSEDYVALFSSEEAEYFKWGLLCIPLNLERRFDPKLHDSIELDYYLRYKPLAITELNGFYAHRGSQIEDSIVKKYYYSYRDDIIARVDTDFEIGKLPFRSYIESEFKREVKSGNFELAFTIIQAVTDFLWGPVILKADNRTEARISELTNKLNDNIIKRRDKFKDRIKLEQEYSKLYLKIDSDYDMIVGQWQEAKRNNYKKEV